MPKNRKSYYMYRGFYSGPGCTLLIHLLILLDHTLEKLTLFFIRLFGGRIF